MEVTSTRGGKRIGAGRKKGLASIKAEEARKYMSDRIASELGPILDGQIEMAKGAYHEEEDENGTKKVYRDLPDPRVAAYLLNQLVGKAKETVDMNVKPPFSLRALALGALEMRKKEEKELLNAPKTQVISYEEFMKDRQKPLPEKSDIPKRSEGYVVYEAKTEEWDDI